MNGREAHGYSSERLRARGVLNAGEKAVWWEAGTTPTRTRLCGMCTQQHMHVFLCFGCMPTDPHAIRPRASTCAHDAHTPTWQSTEWGYIAGLVVCQRVVGLLGRLLVFVDLDGLADAALRTAQEAVSCHKGHVEPCLQVDHAVMPVRHHVDTTRRAIDVRHSAKGDIARRVKGMVCCEWNSCSLKGMGYTNGRAWREGGESWRVCSWCKWPHGKRGAREGHAARIK